MEAARRARLHAWAAERLGDAACGEVGGGGARLTELRLTNVSQTVCGLEGFPRLRFRGADGKPLPTRATNFGASVYAVILAPGALAAIELVWGTLPQCPLAASIDVTPPALATALTIAVGSPSHPMRPCDGAVFVSPVGVSLAKLLGITSRFRAERR